MRVLVVGPKAGWSTADVARGWATGLRDIGVEVAYFDLSEQLLWHSVAEVEGERLDRDAAVRAVTLTLLGDIYLMEPDVVVVVHGADVDWELLRQVRAKVVMVLTECPYENEGQALMCAAVEPDLILLNDPAAAAVFDTIAPAFYVPHAYDPTVHYPTDAAPLFDCCFVGSGFPNRVRFMEQAPWDGIDLTLAGLWSVPDESPIARYVVHEDRSECLDNALTAELYRRSRTGFSLYRDDAHGDHSTADGWAISPREVELAACGTWFARQTGRGESDELFPMLPTYSTPAELPDVIRWALAHPHRRREAAAAARSAVVDRTFANHAARALARLGY